MIRSIMGLISGKSVRSGACRMAMLSALVMLAVGGCTIKSSSGDIGESCDFNSDCASDYCSVDSVCTESCFTHSDCGCAIGTTDNDVANGGCDVACVGGLCDRVCGSTASCSGASSCFDTGLGYGTCE